MVSPAPVSTPRSRRGAIGFALLLLVVMLGGLLSACSSGRKAPGQGFTTTASQVYTVQRGDTVYGISRRFGVPMREIISTNGLAPPFTLLVGQVLRLPGQAVHVVARGDTVYGIARRYGVDMIDLARLNGIGANYVIHVGQSLQLPGGPTPPASAPMPSSTPVYTPPPVTPAPTVVASAPDPVTAPSSPSTGGHPSYTPTPPVGTPGNPTEEGDRITVPARPVTAGGETLPTPPPASKPVQSAVASGSDAAPQASPAAVSSTQAAQAPVPAPPPRAGRFAWPVQGGGSVIARFGPAGGGQHNDGINIAASRGTSVLAAENGVVAYAGNEIRGFGNLLLIKHDGGWMTAYGHNDSLLVRRGDVVQRGQVIAKVGDSGGAQQTQLHFEVRRSGRPVNPEEHLSTQSAALVR